MVEPGPRWDAVSEVQRVTVVALGDLARSPRMCLHAKALASAGYWVEILAYTDTEVPRDLATDERITITSLPTRAASTSKGVVYLVRILPTIVARFFDVARTVMSIRRSGWIIVQNPPALPALPILLLVAWRHRSRVAVDWHNFGWTILGVRLGQGSAVVGLAGWLERWMAGRADLHLCVSQAMRELLSRRYGIDAILFRDQPANDFLSASREEREPMRRAVVSELEISGELVEALARGDAKLLVSSTSWSIDEDFSMLLEALRLWSNDSGDHPRQQAPRPHLLVVVSGLGPLREQFERKAESEALSGVTLRTAWLSESSYPRLLAAADLGVCLHRSTSGVDLPMKLADMFGAGLPACALDYGPCLRELVRDRDNGYLFETAADLAEIWRVLLAEEPELLDQARARLGEAPSPTWQDHWTDTVHPILREESRADLR